MRAIVIMAIAVVCAAPSPTPKNFAERLALAFPLSRNVEDQRCSFIPSWQCPKGYFEPN